jgi:hypothetical protein
MKDPEDKEQMTQIKSIGLFALTVVIGLLFLGSIAGIKHLVGQEFFWYGIHGTLVEFGFFIADVLSLILTGFIASLVFLNAFRSRKDLIVVSACSSGAAGILWLYTLYFLSVYTEIQNRHFVTDALFRDTIFLSFTHLFWSGPFVFLILLGTLVLGIMGSLVFSLVIPPQDDLPLAKNQGAVRVRSRIVIVVFITGMVLSFLLPLVLGIAAIGSCAEQRSQCGSMGPIVMQVTRSDSTTITLHISRDYSGRRPADLIPSTSRPLQIFVDDRDFSNQSLIQEQGLADTINPPEGILTYIDGSSVTLSGPELEGNRSSGIHLYVVSYFDPNNGYVVVDTNV